MDIGAWLRELGLGQYEAAFRDNAVDGAILPKLTADDLKEVGVIAIGHRRRLVDAIAALSRSGDSSDRWPPPRSFLRQCRRVPRLRPHCDRIRRAPADHGDVLRPRRLDQPCGAARRRGLAQSGRRLPRRRLGRRDLARRPCPEEARRRADGAVRLSRARRRTTPSAPCARRSRSSARSASSTPATRATARRTRRAHRPRQRAGRGRRDRRSVRRRAQRRRARASAAEPGKCWSPPAVQRQIAGPVRRRGQGRARTEGRAGDRRALSHRARERRRAARRRARAHPPRRPRGGARAARCAAGSARARGEGQFVHDRRRARPRQVAADRGVPRPARRDAAHLGRMGVVATPAEHAAASDRRMGPRCASAGPKSPAEKRLAELESGARGRSGSTQPNMRPCSRRWSTCPLPEARAPKLAPEELRRRQLAALAAWVLAGARAQPLVLAFEDLHWADPTSLDLLQALAERGAQAPLLIVATARPEFRPPWSSRSHHSVDLARAARPRRGRAAWSARSLRATRCRRR